MENVNKKKKGCFYWIIMVFLILFGLLILQTIFLFFFSKTDAGKKWNEHLKNEKIKNEQFQKEAIKKDSIANLPVSQIKDKNERIIKWAEKNISSWDRSNRLLTKEAKKNMLDPKSFEHIITTFTYNDDNVIGKMTYSGSNSFGGKAIAIAEGTFDYDGNLLKVKFKN